MRKPLLMTLLLVSLSAAGQKSREDSILYSVTDYEDFFNALERFVDSITAPRSFFLASTGISSGYFSYVEREALSVRKQTVWMPALGYFHKNGLGFFVNAAGVSQQGRIRPFQLSATASYDYLNNRKLAAGTSFTRYFTRDSLPFYTSPLSNEWTAYFSYRHWWVKPMIAVSYGWGSRTSMEKRKTKLPYLRWIEGYTTTEIVESVNDLTLTASVKHDFYWLHLLGKKDYLRLSPQLALLAGTQKFGFNQTDKAYLSAKKGKQDLLYQSQNAFASGKTAFQPLSLTASIRSEWSTGIFFAQPQLFADYLMGDSDKKLIYTVALSTGIIF